MTCPKCKCRTEVTDSRAAGVRGAIRRRRWCPKCRVRFTTVEQPLAGSFQPGRKPA